MPADIGGLLQGLVDNPGAFLAEDLALRNFASAADTVHTQPSILAFSLFYNKNRQV